MLVASATIAVWRWRAHARDIFAFRLITSTRKLTSASAFGAPANGFLWVKWIRRGQKLKVGNFVAAIGANEAIHINPLLDKITSERM